MLHLATNGAAMALEAPLGDNPADRRAHPRIPSSDLRVTGVRIPNRPAISLVDLSSGGALLQLPFQARPEARFAVQLHTPVERVEVPFQLLRCYVAELRDGVTYHAAGAFDSLLDLQSLATRASDTVQRLIATLERLYAAGQRAAIQTRADAAFTETLGEVIAMLRRGESVDLVALKVKAHLTQTYPSLAISPSQSSHRDALTSVDGFGYTFKSRHALSVHDRRLLKSHAQLLSMLEACRRDMREEFAPRSPQLVYSASEWLSAQSQPTTEVGIRIDDLLRTPAVARNGARG